MKQKIWFLALFIWCLTINVIEAKTGYYDLTVNSSINVTTLRDVEISRGYGPPDYYYAVFKIWPVTAGKRYEATLTYDAGDNIGFGVCWVDGDPSTKDHFSFVGIGTGTGTKYMPGVEKKYLFSISPESTSNVIYVVVSSGKAWQIKFSVTDKPSGVTRESKDRWGYYYVEELDKDRNGNFSPYVLKRGEMMAEKTGISISGTETRFYGPYKIVTPSGGGTIKILRYAPTKGIAWLRMEGAGFDEILDVNFKGRDFDFFRTLDCRLGHARPIFQKFTGTFLSDDFIQGGFSGSDQPGAIFPWQGQKF